MTNQAYRDLPNKEKIVKGLHLYIISSSTDNFYRLLAVTRLCRKGRMFDVSRVCCMLDPRTRSLHCCEYMSVLFCSHLVHIVVYGICDHSLRCTNAHVCRFLGSTAPWAGPCLFHNRRKRVANKLFCITATCSYNSGCISGYEVRLSVESHVTLLVHRPDY